jgi:hypothetical protein
MSVGRLIAGVVLALALSAPTASNAAEPSRCSLGNKYFVRSVVPYSLTEDAGYTAYSTFLGADMFVPAQPAMTQEWLQRVLSYQVAAGECDFGAANVHVSVMSSGGGFTVRVTGANEHDAKEILRHAQALVK